ncbi:MAG TPA: ATP-binding protein [Nitrososphaeraceae archaeon]|nr:ATP-binding protein [Nitrososphaeraceae archaeon]
MKSNNILNNLIYQVFTKTIKKTNLPITLNKTKLKQIDSHNISYPNQEKCITNKNDINNKIESNIIEIFNDIVGYEDIKKLFIMAIRSVEPIHIALAGPPASAKTIFMRCLLSLPNSYFVDGSNMSKSGLIEYIFNNNIKYLLIDEIDKIPPKDQTVFLNLMETEIVSETKYNKTRKIETKISIFATCNDITKIIYPIRSRFLSLTLKAYSYEEFHKIVSQLLCKKNLNQKIIDEVVYAVWYNIKSKNIRDCIKIAQMANSVDDILFLVKIYEKYNVKKLYP